MPPFDIDPDTFLATVSSIPTDVLVLFYSRTCHDCEMLMPQWSQIASAFESDQDLALLSVADPTGAAPGKYTHGENPAIFFASAARKDDPVAFPAGQVHAFTDTDETADTDAAVRAAILRFVAEQRAAARHEPVAAPEPAVAPAPITVGAVLNPADESRMNARLLVTLKNHERDGRDAQLELLRSPAFAALPVARLLTGLLSKQAQVSLASVAAKYLDVEPIARQWAAQYAQSSIASVGMSSTDADAYRQRSAQLEESVFLPYWQEAFEMAESRR